MAIFVGKCKHKGNPGNPSMSLLNYPPGVVSKLQPVLDPCQDKSLASKSCPLPSTRQHKSGLWKLGIAHASVVMSSLGSGGEGYGLSCFPKDTYYRQMVLFYRSKAALRFLLVSWIDPWWDNIAVFKVTCSAIEEAYRTKFRKIPELTEPEDHPSSYFTLYFRSDQHYS